MSHTIEGPRIGHVHLRVADLGRAISFYRDVLGFEVQQLYGDRAAFLGADGYHHHIGLNTWESLNGSPAPRGHTGLYHTAVLYPDRKGLAKALKRAIDSGVRITGAADHGVSEAVYFDDPDGNGVEIYRDRDPSVWPRDADGHLTLYNAHLDLDALLSEAS